MKKLLTLALVLCAGAAMAGYPVWLPASIAADGVLYASPTVLHAATIQTDGTNDCAVKLYDNASAASGTVLAEFKVTGSNNFGGFSGFDVTAKNGVYGDLTIDGGGTCTVRIYWGP